MLVEIYFAVILFGMVISAVYEGYRSSDLVEASGNFMLTSLALTMWPLIVIFLPLFCLMLLGRVFRKLFNVQN